MIEHGRIQLTTEVWMKNGEWHFSMAGPRWLLDEIDRQMLLHAKRDNILLGLRATSGPELLVGGGDRQISHLNFATQSLKPKNVVTQSNICPECFSPRIEGVAQEERSFRHCLACGHEW